MKRYDQIEQIEREREGGGAAEKRGMGQLQPKAEDATMNDELSNANVREIVFTTSQTSPLIISYHRVLLYLLCIRD